MLQPSIYTLRNNHAVCSVLLGGTYVFLGAISLLLLISFYTTHNRAAVGSLLICLAAVVAIGGIHKLARLKQYRLSAYMLTLFYALLATGIVWCWGINTPIGLLLFGLVIVIAGILLTAWHALYAGLLCGLILVTIQASIVLGWHRPATSWMGTTSSFGDVLGYGAVFAMLALVSWQYNREMERSLIQAKRAESALLQQKATLRQQVKKRTQELRRAQLEEMRQMYRLAELGQQGVTLLHDLANHVSALTLELERLQGKQQSNDIEHARQITHYLETVVESTRDRLNGITQNQIFNMTQTVSELIDFLQYKASRAHVTIAWQPPAGSWKYRGDPASLNQAIAIIINNAIEAYGPVPKGNTSKIERRISITMERDDHHIIIKISDWGKGIPNSARKHLFAPFHSHKKIGLGLGLFIAKQTLETHFGGSLWLSPAMDHTEFVIKLPLRQ
jgi:signal transduction histidine kinase